MFKHNVLHTVPSKCTYVQNNKYNKVYTQKRGLIIEERNVGI
jgi:hypothetical protein